MSGSAEPPLAAVAYRDPDIERSMVDFFHREGRNAGLAWKAFWKEFDAGVHDDGTYVAALKIFIVRYELFLKEGA